MGAKGDVGAPKGETAGGRPSGFVLVGGMAPSLRPLRAARAFCWPEERRWCCCAASEATAAALVRSP